eukprot:CAMPEP_0172588976 /NCGR_PEP_ID=MMETSP1068-20121228/7783_1 /TAXON_ID=35684 /ORGANISM="Pseudopedinella elastica, Strain CCMP716" /LENGTH=437 /DNA_ID=CAMNT_0013384455 /DNA_START=256 /DNA_END=1569 /DNA_ORIENTATION=+
MPQKAAVYDRLASEGVRVARDHPMPRASRGEVLVNVHCAGVNPVDAKLVFGDKLPAWCGWLPSRAVQGKAVGFDFAGTVAAAAGGFEAGEEVFGMLPPFGGSFAQVVSCPATQLARKPRGLSMREAGCLPLGGITCLQAFDQHGLKGPGQNLLVIGGSGGVGHVALQVGRRLGCSGVVAVCSRRNLDLCVRKLGASAAVAYDTGETRTQAAAATERATASTGRAAAGLVAGDDLVVEALAAWCEEHGPFDLVFDTVTSHDSRDRASDYPNRLLSRPGIVRRPSETDGGGAGGADGTVDPHNYVTIGGGTMGWVRAGVKKVLGLNVFPTGRELFWITPAYCAPYLERLAGLCAAPELPSDLPAETAPESDPARDGAAAASGDLAGDTPEGGETPAGGGIRPVVAEVLPLTDEGVRRAFALMHGRRTKGKVVIEVVAAS